MRATPVVLAFTVLASGAAVALPVLTLPAAAARPVTPVVRTVPLAAVPLAGASPAAPQAAAATATTPLSGPADQRPAQPRLRSAERRTAPFSLVAVTWRRAAPGTSYTVAVRTRTGGHWTPWTEVHQDSEAPDQTSGEAGGARDATAPLWVGPSDGVQVSVDIGQGAAPRDLSAVLVDPGRSPADAAVDHRPAASAEAHIRQPTIYRRRHWGADESLRRHAPKYTDTIKAAFVHHTAGTNNYSRADVPAIIRGIYAYHVKGRGWSDVGYNFLVDRFGRIWEGRHGGIDMPVLGAHTGGFNTRSFGVSVMGNFETAGPNVATVQAVAHVIAWKFAMYGTGYGLDPRGKTTLTSGGGGTSRYPAGHRVTFHRVSGHRDAGKTACPGGKLYAKLPRIRALAADRMRRESTHRAGRTSVHAAPAGDAAVHAASAGGVTYNFRGHGWGHGRGLSQWGAARAAGLGKTAIQITDFYYTGSTLGRFRNRTVRVLLTATDGDRVVRFRRQSGLRATVYASDRHTVLGVRSLTDHAQWRVRADAAGLRLEWSEGAAWTPVRIAGRSAFGNGAQVQVKAAAALPLFDEDGGWRLYRGAYRVTRRDAARLRVVNQVAMESQYLPSVVPSESVASWPAAALQAQAIAARSFSAWHLRHPRGADHDLCDSVSCQVYRGVSAETERTTRAVQATRERVRLLNGMAVRTEFSSSNGGSLAGGAGGHSRARYDAWSDGPWDPNHQWARRVAATTIARTVFGPGVTLAGVQVTRRNGYGDWGGRVLSVTFVGRRDRTTVRATRTGEQVRFLLGLRSSYFTLDPPR